MRYHAIKKRDDHVGTCAVKLDMHKTYNKAEWCFLEGILIQLGLDILVGAHYGMCNYSEVYVRVNNDFSDSFTPSQGLLNAGLFTLLIFPLCVD